MNFDDYDDETRENLLLLLLLCFVLFVLLSNEYDKVERIVALNLSEMKSRVQISISLVHVKRNETIDVSRIERNLFSNLVFFRQ